jgi:hypothetical protein
MEAAEPPEKPVVGPRTQRRGLRQKNLKRQAVALPEKRQLQGLRQENLKLKAEAEPPRTTPKKPEIDESASQNQPAHVGGYWSGVTLVANTPTTTKQAQEGHRR